MGTCASLHPELDFHLWGFSFLYILMAKRDSACSFASNGKIASSYKSMLSHPQEH